MSMTQLTQQVTWFWRVTTQGIYFVDNSAKPNALLKFFSFATRTVRTVRQLDKQLGVGLAWQFLRMGGLS